MDRLGDGRQRVVRHGFGPERQIQTGIGPLDVQRPKVRDRAAANTPDTRIRFTPDILPKWARRPALLHKSVRDSSCESSVISGGHEQT